MRSVARWQQNRGEAAHFKHRAIHSTSLRTSSALDPPGGRVPVFARSHGVEWIRHLQWPAMAATLLSAWLVAAQSKKWRQWGFWFFLFSNVLWIDWGWHDHAYALVILQRPRCLEHPRRGKK